MPYVNIDIDLDEFDTDDLLEELLSRKKRERFSNQESRDFLSLIEDEDINPEEKIKTLADQMKYETFMQNFDEFTEQDLDFILESKRKQLRKA